MLLCILNFVHKITAKLILPGAFGQSSLAWDRDSPHQCVLLLLNDINTGKKEFSGDFLALISLDPAGKSLGQRFSRREMFLLLFHELQFDDFSLRSVLRSNFELEFGSVWAGESPPLLVPFRIS